ncbi:unnamed protein product [Adineta steineri]|uniref:G-protein coupled receptors family 1 profile domain-containing protein n=1 Tax=Adineta steineri TaxID=433720 RepID=A0A814YDQ1_9BILA|nr:unnamed protein product [Adineta steineri]CAF1521117.1 unnamed protein product [Adineta steineri]
MNTTSPSTQYNLQVEINKISIYVYPITIILTITTNILNICVLCRRNLRLSSSTQYFLAFALSSILYTCEIPVMMFIRIRYGYIVTSLSVGCRLQTFMINIMPLFISTMLVFASIDRFFVSSSTVRMRNLSQVHIARRIIIITIILTVIYISPILLIYYFNSNMNQCISYSSTIAIIYLSSRIIFSYIIIPFAMAIFGFLIIRNIRNQIHRINPFAINPKQQNRRRYRRIENQLARMLILQVSAYLIFSTPAGVGYTLVTFIPSMNTVFVNQLRIIFSLWQQNIYFLTLFIYILSSKTYRQEFLHMFKLKHF